MNQECSNTTADTPDENQFEEPENACLRRELGLRPIYYPQHGDKVDHPDQRPCPPWCWVGQDPTYGHELDSSRPFEATHTLETTPSVALSLYRGDRGHPADGDRYVHTATLEPHLRQIGQEAPHVKVSKRTYEASGEQMFDYDFLMLSIEDARELATALDYLVKQAERG